MKWLSTISILMYLAKFPTMTSIVSHSHLPKCIASSWSFWWSYFEALLEDGDEIGRGAAMEQQHMVIEITRLKSLLLVMACHTEDSLDLRWKERNAEICKKLYHWRKSDRSTKKIPSIFARNEMDDVHCQAWDNLGLMSVYSILILGSSHTNAMAT